MLRRLAERLKQQRSKKTDEVIVASSELKTDSESESEYILGDELKALLNQIITPKLSTLGLRWRGDCCWIGESVNGIRNIVNYSFITRGRFRGLLAWGVALDFLPLPSGNRFIYNRTEKSAKLHLFEWPEGYIDSFRGKPFVDGYGITSHRRDLAAETINQVIESELARIESFFKKASSIEGLIEIAEGQYFNNDSFGQMHSPHPSYVLSFLYAKNNRLDEALKMIDNAIVIDKNGNRMDLTFVKEKLQEIT